MNLSAFTLAKEADPNEDALAWNHLPDGTILAALADGASSDAFSGLWARCLVEDFCDQGELSLTRARERWRAETASQNLPWFLADKLRQGTHATFLGLTLSPTGAIQVVAQGDTCLFHVRGTTLLSAFPCSSLEALGSHPLLLSTHRTETALQETQLHLDKGEQLLLATDALAGWLLAEQEHAPWSSLLALQNGGDFTRFIQSLRRARRILHDDATLVVVA